MAKNNVATIAADEVASDVAGEVANVVATAPTYDELLASLKTKSAMIRKLHADGWTRSKIAAFMQIRYQHVRNVLTQPLKKND